MRTKKRHRNGITRSDTNPSSQGIPTSSDFDNYVIGDVDLYETNMDETRCSSSDCEDVSREITTVLLVWDKLLLKCFNRNRLLIIYLFILCLAMFVFGHICAWLCLYLVMFVFGHFCVWPRLCVAVFVFGHVCAWPRLCLAMLGFDHFCVWSCLCLAVCLTIRVPLHTCCLDCLSVCMSLCLLILCLCLLNIFQTFRRNCFPSALLLECLPMLVRVSVCARTSMCTWLLRPQQFSQN